MDQIISKTERQQLTLRICDCDLTGFWKPGAIFEAVQEISSAHCEHLGLGGSVLSKENACWISARSEVRMLRYPRLGERIILETIPNGSHLWFFPRYCFFRDEAGETLGYSSTDWAIMDVRERKLLPPSRFSFRLPDNSDQEFPMGHPGPVEAVDGQETIVLRMPRYSDLDINGHVNNVRYVDWACDALGVDVLRDYCLETVRISFGTEIRADQEIALRVARDGLKYRVAGYHGEKMHFELGGTLRRR